MTDSHPQQSFPEPLRTSSISVREVSVTTTGRMRGSSRKTESTTLSRVAMVLGFVSLALTPVFGVGVVPAVAGILLGHIAKYREPLGSFRATVGLASSYLALIIGTAILVIVVLPITLAFLVSTGYLLPD